MGPKSTGRLAGLAIFATSFVAANAGHDLGPGHVSAADFTESSPVLGAQARTVATAATDPNLAQSNARSNFDVVFDNLRSNDTAAIKVVLSVPSGPTQTVWLTPVGTHDDKFLGKITRSETDTDHNQLGDVVLFETAQVLDWHYSDSDGVLFGNFGTRERLADLAPEHAAPIRAILSSDPVPTHWF